MTRTSMPVMVFAVGCALALSAKANAPTVTRDEAQLLERVSAASQDDLQAALDMVNEARTGARASAALDYTAGRLLGRAGQQEAAVKAFRQALEKHPEFTAARMGTGHALASLSRWQEAADVMRPLASDPAADRDALLLYAHVLAEQRQTFAAETTYRRLLQAEGETPDVLLGLARCYILQHRPLEAAAALGSLVRIHPGDPAVWALAADAWLALEQPAKALAHLEVARRLRVADTLMLVQLADLYLYSDLPAAAAAVYREALTANVAAAGAWVLRAAEGLLRAGVTHEAGEWLQRYREQGGELDARYLRTRARWAAAAQDPEAERAAYQAWVAHDPLDQRALLGMGDIERRADRGEHAALWYERARDAHPHDIEPLLRLADLAVARKDYRRAADWLEQAYWLDSRPETHQAVVQLRRLGALKQGASGTGAEDHGHETIE